MTQLISVGKNVARIFDREFPIDNDLGLLRSVQDGCAWNVKSTDTRLVFNPMKDDDISVETFRTYTRAFRQSVAFNEKGKLRRLFERKEQGVKVVPGHGVFHLPSKMNLETRNPRQLSIRVFNGTNLSKSFQYSNYDHMVQAASEYYFAHIRKMTFPVNESLWLPVKINMEEKPEYYGINLPTGVYVRKRGAAFEIRYFSIKKGDNVVFGYAKNLTDLSTMVMLADDQRHKEQMAEAMFRFVRPHFTSFSQYMKAV